MDMSGFHKKTIDERTSVLKEMGLDDNDIEVLHNGLDLPTSNRMIENVIGFVKLPLGVATNFRINGKDYVVPMALEEPSVVAAASNAAKLALPSGFTAKCSGSLMIGQIQLVGVKDLSSVKNILIENKEKFREIVNARDSHLIKLGGGLVDINSKVLDTNRGKMVIIELTANVLDAMGANVVNTMCESLSPFLEELFHCESRLKIVSNLATGRMVKASAIWECDNKIIDGILDGYEFATADVYRCATHNKGIMNGIDALMIATGNDWRGVEAGAHTWASLGVYKPLTTYSKIGDGMIKGSIELPMQCAVVGGATAYSTARVCRKILGVKSASELACVAACLGLANNFAALRAMVIEGIQKGHLRLHASNLAVMAGAQGDAISNVVDVMIKENNISYSRACEIIKSRK